MKKRVVGSRILVMMLVALMYISIMPQTVKASSNKDFVTVMDLNLKSKPDDTASPTVYVPEGQSVKYIGDTSNDWFELEYKGKRGFTHRGNVTSKANYDYSGKVDIHDVKLTSKATNKEFVIVIDVNLRSGNDNKYKSVKLMPEGSRIKHKGTTANGWFRVDYKGQEGYIHRGDVTSVANYNSTDKTIHNVKLKSPATNKEYVSIIDQNLRAGNDKQYKSIKLIKRGDSIKHIGTTANGWFKVDYNGQLGYIYRGDLTSRSNYDKLHDSNIDNDGDNNDKEEVKPPVEKPEKPPIDNGNTEDEPVEQPMNINPDKIINRKDLTRYLEHTVLDIQQETIEIIYYGEDFEDGNDVKDFLRTFEEIHYSTVDKIYKNQVYQKAIKIVYKPFYSVNKAEETFIQKEINRILKENINSNMSEFEKVRVLYDYIYDNTTYSTDTIGSRHSAYTLFKEKKGVCAAYAKAYGKLMDAIGIENMYIIGDATTGSTTGYHGWNKIKIDGEWYNIDPTWGRTYRYFLKSDKEFYKSHKPTGIKHSSNGMTKIPASNNTQYDHLMNKY